MYRNTAIVLGCDPRVSDRERGGSVGDFDNSNGGMSGEGREAARRVGEDCLDPGQDVPR